MELRARGLSYRTIARVMRIGVMTAYDLVMDGIAASVPPELVEMERTLELDRNPCTVTSTPARRSTAVSAMLDNGRPSIMPGWSNPLRAGGAKPIKDLAPCRA